MTWTTDDLATYGDQALDDLRLAVLAEQERRNRLAVAPAMVADMTRRYLEDGGDPAVLTTAIETASIAPAPTSDGQPDSVDELEPTPEA